MPTRLRLSHICASLRARCLLYQLNGWPMLKPRPSAAFLALHRLIKWAAHVVSVAKAWAAARAAWVHGCAQAMLGWRQACSIGLRMRVMLRAAVVVSQPPHAPPIGDLLRSGSINLWFSCTQPLSRVHCARHADGHAAVRACESSRRPALTRRGPSCAGLEP